MNGRTPPRRLLSRHCDHRRPHRDRGLRRTRPDHSPGPAAAADRPASWPRPERHHRQPPRCGACVGPGCRPRKPTTTAPSRSWPWTGLSRTGRPAGPGRADAWIDRTAPYVTAELAERNDRLRSGGRGPGIAWQDFTDRRCTARVLDPAAVIPPEAPRTPGAVRVQAAGTLRTSCAAGTDPPDEALAVTLTAVRTTTGWRIASRDY